MQHTPLAVTPTYNEVGNLDSLVHAVRCAAPDADRLIVHGNRPTGTGAKGEVLAAAGAQIHEIHRWGKYGIRGVYDAGDQRFAEMAAACSRHPRDLPAPLPTLARGAEEVVVGARNILGGGVAGCGPTRHAMPKGGSFCSRVVLGRALHALPRSCHAFARKALEAIERPRARSVGYAFQIAMEDRAFRAGLNLVEAPKALVDRRVGRSRMRAGVFSEALRKVWFLLMTVAKHEAHEAQPAIRPVWQ